MAERGGDVALKKKLISLVREYPAVYDRFHPQHYDLSEKTRIWKEINSSIGKIGNKELNGKCVFQYCRSIY